MATALLAAGSLTSCSHRTADTYPGFIDAPVAAVAAPISGQVSELLVREGEHVKREQLLARLDPRERVALVAEAEANLQHAREVLHESEHNAQATAPTVRAADADVVRQQAELDDALSAFNRAQRLLQSGAGAQAQSDSARARFEAARAGLASLGANSQVTRGHVSAALAAVRTARAAVSSAEAALDLAHIQLAQLDIRSPFEGIVAEQNLQPGEWAAPGTPVVSVEDLTRQWVRIDVEETELGSLDLGRAATIRVVALPGHEYAGHVIEVGAEGEFALNRDVKRGRQDVRTFRVRIGLNKVEDALRPGMTAEIAVAGPRTVP